MKSLFWADQIADEIVSRKKFHYTKDPVPKLKKYVVKSAASVSGVLHIGRLSDTIRCDSVFKALKDSGHKAEFIWTADNVDPLRKIPEGVPKKFREYIGVPVTDIPDPWGCHKSYEEHHRTAYLEVVNEFIHNGMKPYSMREEYLKGTFKKEISLLLKGVKKIIDIQNRYRPENNRLGPEWNPWRPICEKCGKIITTRVTKMRDDGKVEYVCKDYSFKTEKAQGCGHVGVNDPSKGNGKLLFKSEFAAQWAHWKVVIEGVGKEYQVPGSAWWINGEIIERILGFPMPVPLFYEHLMIDGVKMSASLGNVVYPKDWVEVAPPELLRFLYNKKLMKTRSFSWIGLPTLFADYDRHEDVYFKKEKPGNPKEVSHMKRLYELSQIGKPVYTQKVSFEIAAMLAQLFGDKDVSKIVESLKKSGHIKNPTKKDLDALKKRLGYAKKWAELYAPKEDKIVVLDEPNPALVGKLSREQKSALKEFSKKLEGKALKEDDLYSLFWEISKRHNIPAPKFFEAVYLVLVGRESGPRLAPFILAVGQERVAKILDKV
jgi:lysyl-tRNA synthetase class 1